MSDVLNVTNFLIAALLLGITLLWWCNKRKYKLPPEPFGVPILGYLPFIDDEACVVFKRLSEKYGNVISLYLGTSLTVVLNDFDSMKDAFMQNGLLDRSSEFFDFHPGGVGFLGASGKEWIDQRRYVMRALKDIGLGKSQWEEFVQEEVNELMKLIESYEGKPADITKPLSASVSNNITSLVFGKRLLMGDPRRDIVDQEVEALEVFGQVGLVAIFPMLFKFIASLGVFDVTHQLKKMADFNQFLWVEVEYHKNLPPDSNEATFMGEYLKEISKSKEKNESSYFTEENLVGHAQALVTAGSETVRTSLSWLMLIMAAYQDVQAKVDEEIRSVLGRDGRLNWMDRFKLPYTFATIMEVQRWKTVAPLSVAHKAAVDSKVNGFDIPKGTKIFANVWAIHNDPKLWECPEHLNPDRFLDKKGQLKGMKNNGFVPFSTGRRSCPGEVVALIEIFHYFTSLIQNFRILPPSDGAQLNFKGVDGSTYQPVPQKLRFIPK